MSVSHFWKIHDKKMRHKTARERCWNRDRGKCNKCGKQDKDWEVHHIVPLFKGGMGNHDNLQTLCPRCHKLIHHIAVTRKLNPRDPLYDSTFRHRHQPTGLRAEQAQAELTLKSRRKNPRDPLYDP